MQRPSRSRRRSNVTPKNNVSQGIGQSNVLRCWSHGCNGRYFSSYSNYKRHMKEQKTEKMQFICPMCNQSFTRSTARNIHLDDKRCKRVSFDENGVPFLERCFPPSAEEQQQQGEQSSPLHQQSASSSSSSSSSNSSHSGDDAAMDFSWLGSTDYGISQPTTHPDMHLQAGFTIDHIQNAAEFSVHHLAFPEDFGEIRVGHYEIQQNFFNGGDGIGA